MNDILSIPDSILDEIRRQAEREYPAECCGFLFASGGAPEMIVLARPCRNLQDEFHARDPVHFPRTSRNGYYIDPRDLLEVQKETRREGLISRIIYHSHIDAGSYFSEEDSRNALFDGEPLHPGTDYLVVSVFGGRARDYSIHRWNAAGNAFERFGGGLF